MKEKKSKIGFLPNDMDNRIQILEEKFEHQERTIDSLSDVIIGQQAQLDLLQDQIRRLEAILAAIDESMGDSNEPPPPHY
ncbi:MAG: SlyX family protein [Desulforhopalus sp.]